MRRLCVFRPEPGFSVTVETARSVGLQVAGSPLFEIEPVDWLPAQRDRFDGILVGSANVFRHGGPKLDRLSGLRVYAVGQTTADLARERGFAVARTGTGGLQELLDSLAGLTLRLLRLAGEKRVELSPPAGITLDTRVVYRALVKPIDDEVATLLRENGGVVLLHSGEAARHFAEECDRLDVARSAISLAALGPRILSEAGEGWQSVHTPGQPQDAQLLALAQALCKE